MKLKLILAVVASSLCASAAVITNGTFDSNCTGWTATSVDSNGGCRATEGNPGGMFLINNGGASATNPSIEQTVTGLVVGQTYLLQGDFKNYYACCAAQPNNPNAFGVEIDGVVREFDVTLGAYDFNSGLSSAPWQSFSFQFVYSGTSSILRLTGERNSQDVDVAVDNLQISDVVTGGNVPEPSTLALTGAGLLAFALRRRRA